MPKTIINDTNYRQYTRPPVVDGVVRSFGLAPRDFSLYPYGSIEHMPALALPEFSDQEIQDRLADEVRTQSSLKEIGQDCKVPVLDQDGYGYCWAFSTTAAVMYLRATQGEPTVKLSGWMPGCFVKNYRNQGGWCEQSLNHARTLGICTHELFPGPKREYDTPAMREDAKSRIVTEWSDVDNGDRNTRICASLLLSKIPVMVEFNWWAHSVCAIRLVSWKPFSLEIRNSWTESWGDNGDGILEGSRAVPDNMGCPYVSKAA